MGSRQKKDFNDGWRFFLETDGSVDAYLKEFDDVAWRKVTLPHDYSIEMDFDKKSLSGANCGYLNGGVGWYRKSFVLPSYLEGKRVFIQFGSVYMDSTTYVNGTLVGNYPYGYSPFAYDITERLVIDGVTENVIAIKVNHQEPSSRWYSGSGIYRTVDLVITDNVHVERYGTYVTTPNIKKEYKDHEATVHIETKVKNDGDECCDAKVRTTLHDKEGNVFHKGEETEVNWIASGKTVVFNQKIKTVKPELWGIKMPNLYTAKTEVITKDKVVDTYETTFGFCFIDMDPNEGFYINGEYRKLHGACMHHDQGALGAVTNYRAIERQMDTMIDMGVNAIRVTHNPASDELLEICNNKGLLVIDEAFDCWESGKRSKDYGRFFSKPATHLDAEVGVTWAEYDIKNMVNRGKNNPCIIMWSIGNEIVNATVDTARKLVNWVKEVDNTRPTTQGYNNFIDGFDDERMKRVAEVSGVVGFNYGEISYDAAHAQYPNWIMMGSETSSAVRSRGFYQVDDQKKIRSNYDDGNTVPWGLSAEAAWKADRDRKFIMGQFIWTGFDYIGEPSPYHDQWPAKSSYFGAVDTAGIPKDAFYIYQSQWVDVEEKPMVHLLPHWNLDNDNSIVRDGKVNVHAYSNAPSVELLLNGRSLGKKEFIKKQTADGITYQEAEDGHIYLEWKVEYVPGKVEAIARDKNGAEIARDVIETSGIPGKVKLTPDRTVIVADGKDLSYITVEITDKNSRLVPIANNQINFQISGNGEIVGVDNGDATEVTDHYKGNTRKAYSGKAMVIVQSTKEKGAFTLKATSRGLESASTTVFTKGISEGNVMLGYENLEDIYTESDVKPELPKGVVAIYSDGRKESKKIIWNEIEEEKLNVLGEFVLKGRVDETEDFVNINIIVLAVLVSTDNSVQEESGIEISTSTKLKNLALNGETIEGFSPDNYYYTIDLPYGATVPEIFAKTVDSSKVTVVLALSGNKAAVVSVKAEDGTMRSDYMIKFCMAFPVLEEATIRMISTEITQDDVKDIALEAKLQDGTTLSRGGLEINYVLGDNSIAEVKNDRLYAYYPGNTTVKAIVSCHGIVVESNELEVLIAPNLTYREVVEYEKINIITEKGKKPVLPKTVKVIFKDALPKHVPVTWDEITKEQYAEYGEFRVNGMVEGQTLKLVANVLVKGVMGVQQFSTATPIGVIPHIPEKTTLYYSDGTTNETQVVWEGHPQELFMEDGEIVRIQGTTTDTMNKEAVYPVIMKVRVSADSYYGDKFTGYKNGFYWPLGIASYSNKPGALGDSVSKINDNIISRKESDNNRWTNKSNEWRAQDWVGIIFGLEEVTNKFIDNLDVDFYTDNDANVPVEYEVQYYVGDYFNVPPQDPDCVTSDHPTWKEEYWKSVTNLNRPETLSLDETNHFTFDTVETCAIRVVMKAEQDKYIAITEMSAYEKLAIKNDNTELKSIVENEITGTEYNESVTVIMPNQTGEEAKIIVTAENGVDRKMYFAQLGK